MIIYPVGEGNPMRSWRSTRKCFRERSGWPLSDCGYLGLKISSTKKRAAGSRRSPKVCSWRDARQRPARSRSIGSDPVQGALGHKHPSSPKRGGGLGNGHGAKSGDLADEPEAIQEAPGFNRPTGPSDAVCSRQVLCKGLEIGVVASIPGRLGSIGDRLGARAIVAAQRELVEELSHGVLEIVAGTAAGRNPSESRGQAVSSRRVRSKPLGIGRQRCRHPG